MGGRKKKPRTAGKKKLDRSRRIGYDYHLPALLEKAVDYLITDTKGTYIDGTLGGGGHAAEIIRRLASGGKLIAFDKDEEAISHCLKRFKEELDKGERSRIELVNQSFDKACGIESIGGRANGLLLDLGVSSRQLDSESQGFSYRVKTSLDMRFGSSGITAEALLNSAAEEEIKDILIKYGEEPFAERIARRIVQRRRAISFDNTFALRSAVEESVPYGMRLGSLSRVFQAVRIAVNDELNTLKRTLTGVVPILAEGGRIVVISYHSLEDRIVKTFFRERSEKFRRKHTDKDRETGEGPYLRVITKKPIRPSDEEILANPRARSAKLRAAERSA